MLGLVAVMVQVRTPFSVPVLDPYVSLVRTDDYGFSAFEMPCVHYHCMGIGQGTWFRLTDGHVFDWLSRPTR